MFFFSYYICLLSSVTRFHLYLNECLMSVTSNLYLYFQIICNVKQYLDADYIKRLQFNVCKNTSQTVSTTKDKEITLQRLDDKRNLNEIIVQNDDNTDCDITKFKTLITSTTSKQIISHRPTITVPKLKLKPLRPSASEKCVNASVSTKVSSVDTLSTRIRSQRNFDDIEITLAKITTAQRTICSVIDSLM